MRFIPAVSPVRIQVPLPFINNRRILLRFIYTARWSSGQDSALSRRQHGFDSRPGHHLIIPPFSIWRHSSAGRASASHAEGHRFEFCCLHHIKKTCNRKIAGLLVFSVYFLFGGRPPPTGQVTDSSLSCLHHIKKTCNVRLQVFLFSRYISCSAGDPLQRVRSQIRV